MVMSDKSESPWLEIHDEQFDGAALAAAVEERLQRRPRPSEEQLASIPPYGSTGSLPELPADMPYLFDLLHHLRTASRTYHQIETEPEIVPSPATRIPLVGPLWSRVRLFAHQLVLFYVNKHVTHQTRVNYQLVQSLVELTKLNIRLQQEVEALRAEISPQEAQKE